MAKKRSFPAPLTILMAVIVIAAICTWIMPAGQYSKLAATHSSFIITTDSSEISLPLTQKTLDSLGVRISLEKFTAGDIRKPVSIPGTFKRQKRNGQGFVQVLEAPIKGVYDSIEVIFFVLTIGGFMFVFNETGAMKNGIAWLAHTMKGREPLLMVILTFILSFFAASYGMGEEALVFYPILVPLFLNAGYDMMVPFAIIFGGTMVGGIPAFSNPFSTIIASNAAGVNWMDGLYERLILWIILTGFTAWYTVRYAAKVKKDPASSLVLRMDGAVNPPYDVSINSSGITPNLDGKTTLLLLVYLFAFLGMIGGVVFLKWWMLEMTALFFAASILVALIAKINEKVFVKEFVKGAENLLSVALIIGVARGVTIILNEGRISDAILFYTASLVHGLPPAVFIGLLLVFYLFFSLLIQSTSGMAVLTMPIIGALAVIVNIPGREIVNSYMYGICIMSFIAPTGLVLPSLAMVNISFKTWLKFVMPYLILVTLICLAALVIGIYI